MQTLDGIGCSDNSFSLHALHNLGISWSHLPSAGQVLHYVSNPAPKYSISNIKGEGERGIKGRCEPL